MEGERGPLHERGRKKVREKDRGREKVRGKEENKREGKGKRVRGEKK
jgi:hypothetical protein